VNIAPHWKYFAQLFRGSVSMVLVSVVASVAQSLVLLPTIFLLPYIFDTVIPAGNIPLLAILGLAILGLYLINGALALSTFTVTLRLTKKVVAALRIEVLTRFYSLPRQFYDRADLGRLHTSIVQDTERIDIMTSGVVAILLPALIVSIALSLFLLLLNPILSLILLILLPTLIFASKQLTKLGSRRVKAFRTSFETFSKGMLFILQSMDLTRVQAAESFEIARQSAAIDDLRRVSGSMAWFNDAFAQFQNVSGVTIGIVILIVGGAFVANGTMTVGKVITFYVAFTQLTGTIRTVTSQVTAILLGNEALKALFQLMHDEESQPYTGTEQIDFRGGIALEEVTFRYATNVILRETSLTLRPGEKVAIVGANGAGKSTIVNLILGFYRPESGALYAEGQPYADLDVTALRRGMGIVLQEPIIFAGTVAENIACGHPDATHEQIAQAARQASADEFISQLDQDYETFIGENGVLLSGGQRQRIAIARALLRQPALLIFDEPTNHLAQASVRSLLDTLRSMQPAPALLVISHDRAFVRDFDHVYLLENATLAEIQSVLNP